MSRFFCQAKSKITKSMIISCWTFLLSGRIFFFRTERSYQMFTNKDLNVCLYCEKNNNVKPSAYLASRHFRSTVKLILFNFEIKTLFRVKTWKQCTYTYFHIHSRCHFRTLTYKHKFRSHSRTFGYIRSLPKYSYNQYHKYTCHQSTLQGKQRNISIDNKLVPVTSSMQRTKVLLNYVS